MANNKDYTKKTFSVTSLVIVMLVGISFIPSFKVGGMIIKRANILSDIIPLDDDVFTDASIEALIDTSFYDDLSEDILQKLDRRIALWDADSSATASKAKIKTRKESKYPSPVITDPSIVPIEDFSEGEDMMGRFYNSLAFESPLRTVRIAVLGDSFIEADIITVDMREQLQDLYGGSGPGFMPFSTPLSKYRKSIPHTHTGWETYNIVNKKSVPQQYKDKFFAAGVLCVPASSALSEYKGSDFRRHLDTVSCATLLFVNEGHASLSVRVNGNSPTHYRPTPSGRIETLAIRKPIGTMTVSVDDAEGFVGYGVVLEDPVGVSVHNYSVRSNSGTAILGTNTEFNREINELMPYDLIIIQYGLNAMSPDVLNYDYYGKQIVRIIEYVRLCFPQSAIMVMSVGDRSTQKDGQRVTMPAAKAMIETQRRAAQTAGVAFWNTFEAMGGENSMVGFVERKWAAKDHTHIGFPGGKYIATQFVRSVDAATRSVKEQVMAKEDDLQPDTVRGIFDADFHVVPEKAVEEVMRNISAAAPAPSAAPMENQAMISPGAGTVQPDAFSVTTVSDSGTETPSRKGLFRKRSSKTRSR